MQPTYKNNHTSVDLFKVAQLHSQIPYQRADWTKAAN